MSEIQPLVQNVTPMAVTKFPFHRGGHILLQDELEVVQDQILLVSDGT